MQITPKILEGALVGRPRKALLDRDRIVVTALRLVDEGGAESLTMRSLGRELGVNPSSLYNHVGGRPDIVEEIRGVVSAPINWSVFDDLPWPEALVVWARSYRAAFAHHPRSIPLLMSTAARSPVAMQMWDAFTAAAVRAGWPLQDVLPVLTAMESFILGSVLDMSGPDLLFDPHGQEAEFPEFAAAFDTVDRGAEHPIAERGFEWGLRALVASAARPGGAV
jgi:AcrR family transcriptional regulator